MILKMAFRNVFRHKKRSLITISSMIFGILLTMFANGLNKGIERQMIDIYIKTEIGENKVYAKNYYKDKENNENLKFLINDIEYFEKNFLKNYNANLVFDGILNTGEEDYPITIKGVNKEKEEFFFNRSKDIIKGRFLLEKNDLVIGSKIAELLGLDIKDDISIVARTKHGSINAYDKKISGIIKTENTILNTTTVFMDLKEAQNLALTNGVNQIIINGKIDKNIIEKLNEKYDLVNWQEELKNIIELISMKIKNTTYVGVFIMLIAAVGITNTMLMAMLEREKEIGILMANGMGQIKIMILFVVEGGFIGLIGSGIGFIFGTIAVLLSEKYGIPLPDYTDMGMQMVFPDKMYGYFDFNEFFMYFLAGVLIAVFSSLYAAYKASRLNPVEILHRT